MPDERRDSSRRSPPPRRSRVSAGRGADGKRRWHLRSTPLEDSSSPAGRQSISRDGNGRRNGDSGRQVHYGMVTKLDDLSKEAYRAITRRGRTGSTIGGAYELYRRSRASKRRNGAVPAVTTKSRRSTARPRIRRDRQGDRMGINGVPVTDSGQGNTHMPSQVRGRLRTRFYLVTTSG